MLQENTIEFVVQNLFFALTVLGATELPLWKLRGPIEDLRRIVENSSTDKAQYETELQRPILKVFSSGAICWAILYAIAWALIGQSIENILTVTLGLVFPIFHIFHIYMVSFALGLVRVLSSLSKLEEVRTRMKWKLFFETNERTIGMEDDTERNDSPSDEPIGIL